MSALCNTMLIWTETAYIAPLMGRRKERVYEKSVEKDRIGRAGIGYDVYPGGLRQGKWRRRRRFRDGGGPAGADKGQQYTYAMEMAISAEGQSVEMKADGTAEVTMNPSAAKMTMNMDMLGMALKDVQIYMVSEGGQMMAYTGMDMTGAGQNQWYKSQADASGMNTDQYDAVEAFELYMKNGSNFKAVGTDTVQGASATRYEGVITSDMLEDTLEESGSLESITSLLGEDYSSALAGMSGIPITIWINDAGLPVKYVFDMTSMMTELLQSSEDSEDADATVDKFIMSMEVLGYNDVDAITVPQEVLDSAADVTEEAG